MQCGQKSMIRKEAPGYMEITAELAKVSYILIAKSLILQ